MSGRLVGIFVCCLVAVGCSGAEMSNPDDPLVAVSGQDRGGAGLRATEPVAPGPGLQSGPTAGRAATTTGGATAPSAAAAGIGAAQPTAGAAGAPSAAGSAGTATAGAPSLQAGTGGGGAAGSAGAAGAKASATGPCPLPLMQHVDDGVPVNGAGCMQQWEGIVMTKGGRGLCTAAFISDRHLISASHCYARDGAVSLDVSAPTWESGASHTFQAQVKRSGSDMSLDISIIDLGKPVDWATPERRFVLHAGKVPASVDMHLYGFGDAGSNGAGKLRGVPERATISVKDNGRGTLSGKAGDARLCSGDSGGPAFVEKTAAVLYGINQAIVPAGWGGGGAGSCAGANWDIMFTNVSAYMDFIEESLGKPCERTKVDDLDVARCG